MSQAIESHRKAVNASLEEMAATLVTSLGRVITAYIVGVRNPKTISRWASGEVASVRDRYSEERLLAAFQIVRFLMEYEGVSTIRAFMLGMNPDLNDASPADRLREGDYKEVMRAAKSLVADSY